MRWRLSFSPNSHLEGSMINVTTWTNLGCWPCFCQRFWIVKSRSKILSSCFNHSEYNNLMIWWSIYKRCCLYLSIFTISLYIALYIYIPWISCINGPTWQIFILPPSKGATWSWRKNCWNCSLESWGIRLTSPKNEAKRKGCGYGFEWRRRVLKHMTKYIHQRIYKRMVCISYLYNYDIIMIFLYILHVASYLMTQ